MSGLVTRDLTTLARALCETSEEYRETYPENAAAWQDNYARRRWYAQAQALIDSGAVTPLADAVEALAEDDALTDRSILRAIAAAFRGGAA